MNNQYNFDIPVPVSHVTETIQKAGFEAYLVGGCVRDLIMGRKPLDWDITTNALPDQIIDLFPGSFYENKFGTVGVVNEKSTDNTLDVIEVTTYRLEAFYSDSRHPDFVSFSNVLYEDLKRRDFTINAMAYDIHKRQIIDMYKGQNDLSYRIIRAVGDPEERFTEDPLRIMRCIRLSVELGFKVSHETFGAAKKNSKNIKKISKERIRDEFIRIVSCENPMQGIKLMQETGVLDFVLPELEKGINVDQNQAHKYDVWGHNLRTMQHAASKEWNLNIRIAALLHDIGKPYVRKWSEEKKDWTFHGHDLVGARVSHETLSKLKFPKKTVENITKLVRWHMFFSDPEKITLSAVRRLIRNVGEENVYDLMKLRICDRIGTGRPKEQPYRLRKYQSMIEEASRDPLSVKMLKIKGDDIMAILKIDPCPKIGYILQTLLDEIIDDPQKNSKKYLLKRSKELGAFSDGDLKKSGERGKQKKENIERIEVETIRKKFHVK